MSSSPPPNAALADLAAVLGADNVRTLVRTFLRDFPLSFQGLTKGDRPNRHRLAHSMKSNSRLMGAIALSQRMAELEKRLSDELGDDVTQDDLAKISAEFEAIAIPLRKFVGD
jgi:HPt (histidine-containing phosphotransfer) domain-containing protein